MTQETISLDLDEEGVQILLDVGANVLIACFIAGKTYQDVLDWLLTESENVDIEERRKTLIAHLMGKDQKTNEVD